MDAVEWLLDIVGRKIHKKLKILNFVFVILLLIALNFVEINVALSLSAITSFLVTERIFSNEIIKNNVIPLKIICCEQSILIKLFAKKIVFIEIIHVLNMMVVCIVWNCLHHTAFVQALLTLVSVGMLSICWYQCVFLHLWLLLYCNKIIYLFETGIIVVVNFVLQLAQMFSILRQVALLACAIIMLLIAFVGKRFVICKGEKME